MKRQATWAKGSGRGRFIFMRKHLVFSPNSIHLHRRDNGLLLLFPTPQLVKEELKLTLHHY